MSAAENYISRINHAKTLKYWTPEHKRARVGEIVEMFKEELALEVQQTVGPYIIKGDKVSKEFSCVLKSGNGTGAIQEEGKVTDAEEFEQESFAQANDEFDQWYAAQPGNEGYPIPFEERMTEEQWKANLAQERLMNGPFDFSKYTPPGPLPGWNYPLSEEEE